MAMHYTERSNFNAYFERCMHKSNIDQREKKKRKELLEWFKKNPTATMLKRRNK